MKRENIAFIIFGIPTWILNVLFLIESNYPGIMFDVIVFIMVCTLFLYKKKTHLSIHAMKAGFIIFIMFLTGFIASNENPAYWVEQSKRNVDPSLLITPEDPYILELKDRFELWIESEPSINGASFTKYSTYYDEGKIKNWVYTYQYLQFENISTELWKDFDTIERSTIIDFYVRSFIVNWTSDSEVYGMGEYKATPHQILQQMVDNGWTKPARDDCDGQAVVTVSLMKSMGINAYIGDGRAHWFTVVEVPAEEMEDWDLENVIILNFWQGVHLWCYFNEDEFYLGQPPLDTLLEITYMDDESSFEMFFSFASNYAFLTYFIALVSAFLIALFLGYPRDYDSPLHQVEIKKRMERKNKIKQKVPWLYSKMIPLAWILFPFTYYIYIRTGNPFRKIYKKTWINGILSFLMIVMAIILLLNNQGNLSMHALIYMNLYIVACTWIVERDHANKLWEWIKSKFLNKKATKI